MLPSCVSPPVLKLKIKRKPVLNLSHIANFHVNFHDERRGIMETSEEKCERRRSKVSVSLNILHILRGSRIIAVLGC